MSSESQHEIYQKQVVFIFDECHRSQFGEAQKRLRQKFKKYIQEQEKHDIALDKLSVKEYEDPFRDSGK